MSTAACKWRLPLFLSPFRPAGSLWFSSGRGSTASLHSCVPNSHRQTPSPETQLSISPNRLVTGITRLRSLSRVLLGCIVETSALTCAWRHLRKNFYTLFIRGATNNWLGVFPVPFSSIKERRMRCMWLEQ